MIQISKALQLITLLRFYIVNTADSVTENSFVEKIWNFRYYFLGRLSIKIKIIINPNKKIPNIKDSRRF
jgi:hypothetical protein